MTIATASMRSFKVAEPNTPLKIQESAIPEPGPNEVRLKVQACGICHSDSFAVQGGFPGTKYPVVPGHEIAIARGQDKKELATTLGAHHYIDSEKQDVAKELFKLGGAKVVLATVTNAKAMSAVIDGLAIDGELLIVGASVESLTVSPNQLLSARRQIKGWASGKAIDSQETMNFSALSGIKPMVETYPLADAAKGYERMMSGKARFRVVLVP